MVQDIRERGPGVPPFGRVIARTAFGLPPVVHPSLPVVESIGHYVPYVFPETTPESYMIKAIPR